MSTITNGENANSSKIVDSSGNTKALASFKIKTKNLIMTIPEITFKETPIIVDYLTKFKSFNYLLICEHDGPEKIHRHLYAQWNNAVNLDSLHLYNCHIEKAFGSAQSNIKYLKAEDAKHKKLGVNSKIIMEMGQPNERGGCKIGDIKKMTDDEILNLSGQMYNIATKIRPPAKTKINEWYKKVKVYYIHGTTSGIGKTLSIFRILGLNKRGDEGFTEIKHSGNFWLGVSGEEVSGIAIYDDFRDSDMKPSEFINFIDYHIHNMDFKGGSAKNKFDLIIITSIQSPYEIYKNMKVETRNQWIRRIKYLNLDKININQYTEVHNDDHKQVHNNSVYPFEINQLDIPF